MLLSLFLLTNIILSLLAIKNKQQIKIAVLLFVSIVLNQLFFVIYSVCNKLTGEGINQSVIYTLHTSAEGAGIKEFTGLIISTSCIITLIFIFNIFACVVSVKRAKKKSKSFNVLLIGILAISFSINPFYGNIYKLANNFLNKNENLIGAFSLINPSVHNFKSDPENQKNLIFFYLESIEQGYFDEREFPGLLPNLSELKKKSLVFDNLVQPVGTGWTIAGMVGSQCGIPLTLNSKAGNSLAGSESFLENAACIGDILSSNGYRLSYLGGANLNFSGKGAFYKTHGFSSVKGSEELKTKLKDATYLSNWGIYDDNLYQYIYEEYFELSKTKEPFALFSINLDTHFPKGHVSKFCENIKYEEGKDPILNAVHCTDIIIGNLINKIKRDHKLEDVALVFASDHLSMQNTSSDRLEMTDRKMTYFIYYPKSEKGDIISRSGTTFDIAPTTLAAIGFNIKAMGYGRNLFNSNSKTIRDVMADNQVNEFIETNNAEILKYWNFPDLDKGFKINNNSGTIDIQNQAYKIPALFLLKDGKVKNIYYDLGFELNLYDEVKKINDINEFIWIDNCNKIVLINKDFEMPKSPHYCLLNKNGKNVLQIKVLNKKEYLKDEIF